MMEPTPLRRRFHHLFQAAIVAYWLSMFWATHVPRAEVVKQLPATDKQLHLAAYFLLGLIVPFWTLPVPSPTVRRLVRLWCIVVLYGAIDELLQIPVGRSCELLDWCADAAGAAGGVLVAAVVTWLTRRQET